MRTFRKGIFPYAFILSLMSFLMAKEPHLSGLILIVAVGVVLLFVGGIHPAWIIAGMAAVSFAAYLLLSGAIPYGQSRIAMIPLLMLPEMVISSRKALSLLDLVGFGGLALARADKNSCFCRKYKMTLFSLSSQRNLGLLVRLLSSLFFRCLS